jgi:uncharacterized LabA/DUF88 family protein
MKDIGELKKIAVLIDAENAQLSKLKLVLSEISTHGHVIVKKAYGDWANPVLKNWKDELNELAIQPVQQFSYTTGKNATDAAMIIDAMDLLYTEKYDAFVLVSSDSDFTKLASRLRESEIFVFGVGESKTPKSFRNACDDFILTENLKPLLPVLEEPKATTPISKGQVASAAKAEGTESIESVVTLLDIACEKYADEEGWVNVGSAGSFIKRSMPDFDARSFGYQNLPELIKGLTKQYETKKYKGKGTTIINAYRKKQS